MARKYLMTTPDNYRYHTSVTIRYADLDRMGHVNNAKYLTYVEQARVCYFRDVGFWDGIRSDNGVIVAKTVVEYKLPLGINDSTVDVWTRCSRLGNKSFDIQSVINRSADGLTAATALTVVVAYNYENAQTIVIPENWRKIILDYEPDLK